MAIRLLKFYRLIFLKLLCKQLGYFLQRAALALTEAVTLISVGQIPDEVYTQAAQTLSEAEIAAVEWIAIVINAWNRIAISSRYPVNP